MDRRYFLIQAAVAAAALTPAGRSLARYARRAPLLFADREPHAPLRVETLFLPAGRLVEVNASVLDGPFAFVIAGREYWKRAHFADTEAGTATTSRIAGCEVFRFYEADTDSLSTLTSNGEQVAGFFQSHGERWALYPVSGTTHLLVRDDEVPLVCTNDEVTVAVDAAPAHPRRRAVRFVTAKGNWEVAQWNLGLWYHPRFAASVGGDANARLLTQAFADAENTALIETGGTYARIALAVSELVGVNTAGEGGVDYASVSNVSDGLHLFQDDPVIRQKRYDRKVSISGYLDAVSDIATGLASPFWGGVPHKNSGTFAVFCGKIPAFGAIVHEIGHNLGLHHDVSSAPSNAHQGTLGFINCRGRVECAMSSSPDCVAHKQLFYSNQDRTVAGAPFGSDNSDAARVIRNYRLAIRDEFWQHAIEGDM